MKPVVKELLTSVNKLNVMLKRNSLMLEELSTDWQNIFKEASKKSNGLTKLNKEQRNELLNKTNQILTLTPTYYNNNPTILYQSFQKDIATYLNNTSLSKDDSFVQLFIKQQTLEFEYSNYQKQKESFSETLKSINLFRNLLTVNDEMQK